MGYQRYTLRATTGKVVTGLLTTNNIMGVAIETPSGSVWLDREKVASLAPVKEEGEVAKATCIVPGCTSPKAGMVPHDNCLYGGQRNGHSSAHCTADACY